MFSDLDSFKSECLQYILMAVHYTSLQAFKSIIDTEQLWLTNIAYMNDNQELRGLLELAAEICEEKCKCGADAQLVAFYRDCVRELQLQDRQHVYVSCFSHDEDDLAQWREYADDGHGVAINLDLDRIVTEIPKADRTHLFAVDVDYAEAEHRAFVQNVLEKSSLKVDGDSSVQHAVASAVATVVGHAAKCKQAAFYKERETRLILRPQLVTVFPSRKPSLSNEPTLFDLTFKVNRDSLVPIAKVPVSRDTVQQVMLGPCCRGHEPEQAMRLYLAWHGMDPELVKRSKCGAYRSH